MQATFSMIRKSALVVELMGGYEPARTFILDAMQRKNMW